MRRTAVPRVLYFTSNEEDYLSDGLFHGLRQLLGADVVDFPKHTLMYETASPALRQRSHGQGFTLYGRLPDIEVDRYHVFRRASAGDFDLIVLSDIQRQFGYLMQLWDAVPHARLAIVDGADTLEAFPYSGRFLRSPHLALLPRCRDLPYFKREIDVATLRAYAYRALPSALAARMRLPRNVHPIGFSIPQECVLDAPRDKDQDFPAHIVDVEVANALGRSSAPAFRDEAAYHADLRRSRFGVTTKRSGWDCLRHYEIAAAGAVPCFRRLGDKHPACAPHGLHRGNTLVYRDADDLMQQIAALSASDYAQLQRAALAWAADNTTVVRARSFLSKLGVALP